MNLPAALRDRVATCCCLVCGDEAVRLACDLVLVGEDAPALAELPGNHRSR